MADKNSSNVMPERGYFSEMVKRRTKELYQLKTGKVSETDTNPDNNNISDYEYHRQNLHNESLRMTTGR